MDEHQTHYYQPGFLFIPFGTYSKKDVCKDKAGLIPKKIEYIQQGIDAIKAEERLVQLKGGQQLGYDILIIATGSKIVPGEIEGLAGEGWMKNAFDFYTIEGAIALAERLKTFQYKQIGNAVPVNLAYHMGVELVRSLNEHHRTEICKHPERLAPLEYAVA